MISSLVKSWLLFQSQALWCYPYHPVQKGDSCYERGHAVVCFLFTMDGCVCCSRICIFLFTSMVSNSWFGNYHTDTGVVLMGKRISEHKKTHSHWHVNERLVKIISLVIIFHR